MFLRNVHSPSARDGFGGRCGDRVVGVCVGMTVVLMLGSSWSEIGWTDWPGGALVVFDEVFGTRLRAV